MKYVRAMDVRAMGDDSVVVIAEEDDEAKSAWPAWKHLLEVVPLFLKGDHLRTHEYAVGSR